MERLKYGGIVAIDVSNMKNGDVTSFSAFNGDSDFLSVRMNDSKKYLSISTNVVDLDSKKKVRGVRVNEKESIELKQNTIYLRIDGDFSEHKDLANFYYSLDNKNWMPIGSEFKIIFDYGRLLMGTKFAIYNYATKEIGGYVDVDFFKYDNKKNKVTVK